MERNLAPLRPVENEPESSQTVVKIEPRKTRLPPVGFILTFFRIESVWVPVAELASNQAAGAAVEKLGLSWRERTRRAEENRFERCDGSDDGTRRRRSRFGKYFRARKDREPPAPNKAAAIRV